MNMCGAFTGAEYSKLFSSGEIQLFEGILCCGPAAPNEDQDRIIENTVVFLRETYPEDRCAVKLNLYSVFGADYYRAFSRTGEESIKEVLS